MAQFLEDIWGNNGDYAAYENADGTSFAVGNMWVKSNSSAGTRRNGGIVLHAVGIPQGSTIDSAFFATKGEGSSLSQIAGDMYMNDVDDADNFIVDADVTSRVKTSASVLWSSTSLNQNCNDANINSPDVKSVVQEIVDRPGWVSGGDMVFLIFGRTSGTTSFVNRAAEACNPHPQFIINYTEPAAGGGGAPGGGQAQAVQAHVLGQVL